MAKSKIGWTDDTWNPTAGCSVVSPGCKNCYAMERAGDLVRRFGSDKYDGLVDFVKGRPVWNGKLRLWEKTLYEPLKWRKPRKGFVDSMSDLFHADMPEAWIDQAFAVMTIAEKHEFQILTKRENRLYDYMSDPATRSRVQDCGRALVREHGRKGQTGEVGTWPPHNVLLGVSVEDPTRAAERIPLLLETPAAIRFLSCEPLLEALDLSPWIARLDWVIAGGESGPRARPCHPNWIRAIRDLCRHHGKPFFFKQWGQWAPGLDDRLPCVAMRATGAFIRIGKPPADSELRRERRYLLDSWRRDPAFCYLHRCAGKDAAGNVIDGRVWEQYPGHKEELPL